MMFISIVHAAEAPKLSVSLVSSTPEPAQPGQDIDIILQIANTGDPTSDAWLEIVEDYPFTVLPSGDADRARNLKVVSGTQKLQFRLRIDKDAQDGLTPLRIRYSDTRQGGYAEETLNIQIETFGARLGIDRVEQQPERFEPGQKGEVAITLTNYDDQPLHNLDVVLDLANVYTMNSNMDNTMAVQAMINARLEDVNRRIAAGQSPLTGVTPMGVSADGTMPQADFMAVAPVGSSTLKRIGTLLPDETITVVFDVQAMPDVTPGIYATSIYVNYNDEDNNPFHTKSEIPLLIDMDAQPVVQLKSSTLRSTDFAGDVTVLVANRGLGDLRYVSVELLVDEGYQLITAPSEVYMGTLAQGEFSEATFTVLPHEELLRLPVRLTFRDSYNNLLTVDEELTLDIINSNYYRDMPYEMMLSWIILGVVVLALTGYFLHRLSKK